ncbi:hypothetical protein P7C73_g4830, partial [Tremellales sp. Uapishka_1]
MSCSHDANDHDHDQSHPHSHSHEIPLESGPQDSLFSQIDVPNVVAMNATGGADAGKRIIKSWDDREDEIQYCESEADDSLIIKMFSTWPRLIQRSVPQFVNNPTLDFSDAEGGAPTQTFDVVAAREGVEYQVKAAKFASLLSLSLYFPENDHGGDEETTRIFYVGLRGKWTPIPNRPGVIIYESAARPTDHKVEGASEAQAWTGGY